MAAGGSRPAFENEQVFGETTAIPLGNETEGVVVHPLKRPVLPEVLFQMGEERLFAVFTHCPRETEGDPAGVVMGDVGG